MRERRVDDRGRGSSQTRDKVVQTIQRMLSKQRVPVVVALDGGSGAGKSTLATWIEAAFDTALIPLDDFFAADVPDGQWDAFTVEEKLARVFDWARVRAEAIEPLWEGRTARWHAFDFASGPRPDGTYGMEAAAKERAPADVILIEGAYSASPALADVVDLAILVNVPVEERHARLRDREEAGFLERWHARWDAVEAHYFHEVRPRDSFDLVVGCVPEDDGR
jgi:uridine kinase